MLRPLAALLAAAVGLAAPTAAQPKEDPLDRFTYKLSTTPAPAPAPGLRTEFRVRATERLPGNAALDYYRAVVLLPAWPQDPEKSGTLRKDLYERWPELSLDELPVDDVTAYLKQFADGFKALDAAAKRDTVDWRQEVKPDPVAQGGFLQEIQKFREVGALNRLRVRRDLARNKFDDAALAVRSGFQFGKAIGEGPVTIQMLVGLAVCQVSVGGSIDFIGRPGSPNLYWALASLPRPLIDPRPALEGEEEFMERGIRAQVPYSKETAAACRAIWDDQRRAFTLPYPRATAALDKIAARTEELKKERSEPAVALFALGVPAFRKCYHAHARLDRWMAGLMAVEAVRLHAAEAKGTPPAALADITAAPVPPDPYTGRPFEYAARADGFTLTAPIADGIGSGFRVEITFRR
ncbi:MAG TPA: hypothetical protein VH092_18675 [Urbifossiella sp.]|jgi:hypothetical protein|nr:hypothetical protein [Urbifossiella sp.]